MKLKLSHILLVILILSPVLSFGQSEDSILISKAKLIELAQEKEEYNRREKLYQEIILKYEEQTSAFDAYKKQDSIQDGLYNMQLKSMKSLIDYAAPYKKQKWYESNWFYYVLGSATMYLSASIVARVK